MRATTGEAGHGVYAYPASQAKHMRSYYGSGGETVWRLAPHPEADAWLVRHEGAGLPSGKQLIIRSLSAFQVTEVGRSGPDTGPDTGPVTGPDVPSDIATVLIEPPGPA